MSHLSYQPLQTYQPHRNGKKRFTIVLLIIIIIVTVSVMLYRNFNKKETTIMLANALHKGQAINQKKKIKPEVNAVAKIEVIEENAVSDVKVADVIKNKNKTVTTKSPFQPKKVPAEIKKIEIKRNPKAKKDIESKKIAPTVKVSDTKKIATPTSEAVEMPSIDKELMALNIADASKEQKERENYLKGQELLLSKAQEAYDSKDYFATHFLLKNIVNKQNIYAVDKIKVPVEKSTPKNVSSSIISTATDSAVISDSIVNDATELTLNEDHKKQAEKLNASQKIPFELWLKMARLYSNANAKTFFSGKSFAPFNKTMYQVKRGDALQRIAKKFRTTIAAIQRQNGMDKFNYNIRVGENLNVYNGDLHIVINKSKFLLMLYDENNLFTIYNIALGKNNKTPMGNFKTVSKVIEPDWYSDNGKIAFGDKRNVLGTRWMEIKATDNKNRDLKGYGIHGTWERNSINKMRSNGCVRMLNENIEEIFDIIPLNTPIKIIE